MLFGLNVAIKKTPLRSDNQSVLEHRNDRKHMLVD